MTSTDSEKDRVISRVRKMLALSNDAAASEGERDNALRMAHATLAKYNLSLGDAETKNEERIDAWVEISPHAWARAVCLAIANLYFCEYFYCPMKGSQRIKHYFVGRESSVVTAQEMARYVVKSITRQARIEAREHRAAGKFERDFCKGAAASVFVRCKEIRETAERAEKQQTASAGTSLVLASLYKTEKEANALVIEEKHGKLRTTTPRQRQAGHEAFNAGRQYGNSISLNNQIAGS